MAGAARLARVGARRGKKDPAKGMQNRIGKQVDKIRAEEAARKQAEAEASRPAKDKIMLREIREARRSGAEKGVGRSRKIRDEEAARRQANRPVKQIVKEMSKTRKGEIRTRTRQKRMEKDKIERAKKAIGNVKDSAFVTRQRVRDITRPDHTSSERKRAFLRGGGKKLRLSVERLGKQIKKTEKDATETLKVRPGSRKKRSRGKR